jgi:hypothetical protein
MFESEEDEIGFLAHFARLEDPRQAAKTLYPLNEVLLVSLCGVICGADSWVEVARFGKMKLEFLRRFLPFTDGVPSHDTFGDVFAALDPEAFQTCFVVWTASLARHIEGVVAIDGKTLRRSFDQADGQAAIHMVSAWSSSQHLVLGQEKVADKSNEIAAIPKLLDLLSLKGAIVTIDAIGCQTAIARKIVAKEADYVLACSRAPKCAAEYQGRLSGPLLDRIDLHVDVPAVEAADLALPPPAEGSAQIATRVAAAREIQRGRYRGLTQAGEPLRCNAQADGELLDRVAAPDAAGKKLLTDAASAMRLSARGYHRVLRVARTLADLEGNDAVKRIHVAEALSYRRLQFRS